MTTPARPGVFVSTTLTPLLTGNQGIPGEAVPCFALPYNRGPIGPVLIKSWQTFTRLYGNFNVAGGSYLHYAVSQFFANGGRACYVLRCPNTDAAYATTNIDGVGSDVSTPILTVKATSPGAWGNQVFVTVASAGQTGRSTIAVYVGATPATSSRRPGPT